MSDENTKSEDDLLEEFPAKSLKNRGYKILEKICDGSFAKVYIGEFTSTTPGGVHTSTTKLAVKVVQAKRKQQNLVKKFLPREISIMSEIEHPYIIHIHSILKIGQTFFIFMRFAELGDLLEFIVKNGTISENQARVWTRQIAVAIQYLHALNIAHRDLKCDNILVTKNHNLKISDFGFARYTIDSAKNPILSETYCGTLLYASPEIVFGHPYNPKIADFWSIGVVLYCMLNKALPFSDNNPKTLFENQMTRNYKFRSKVIQYVSREVKRLVYQLLEPDPAKRCCVEDIINSDWIAMDDRLLTLSPLEQTALSSANKHQPVPPVKIALPNQKKRKQSEDTTQHLISVADIKPYIASDKPRISEDLNEDQFNMLEWNTTNVI